MIRCDSAGLTGGALFAAVSMSNLHGHSSVFFQLRPYW